MHDEFSKVLSARLRQELPGVQAHFKMMRAQRISASEARIHHPNARESAVLLLLYLKHEKWHSILIERQHYPGVHSGQISFPGGKMEIEDPDIQATALRETEEEIGIKAAHISLLGTLTELFIPPSNFLVQPFVGLYNQTPIFRAEQKEVASLIEFPISLLLEHEIQKEESIYLKDYDMELVVPCFKIEGHTVWGATAMILQEFKELLTQLPPEHL